jgi:cell division protein FtsI (penicillin-binding protein 3)
VEKRDNLRTNLIYLFFFFSFLLIFLRVSYLQLFKKDFFKKLSFQQYYRLLPLQGKRGNIFDRRKRLLATTMNTYSIFADPFLISSPKKVSELLSKELDLSEDVIYKKIKDKNRRFVWIKRKICWEEKERVRKLKIKGIGFLREEKRFYPQGNLVSHILGRVDIDNKGLEGVELTYDEFLRGKSGWVKVFKDSTFKEVIFTPQIITPQEGKDIILTLDSQIQYWTEKFLAETIKKFKAKGGSVIVMDGLTGEIIALANYPDFDPNQRGVENTINRAISEVFEPGSVFKIVTLLAALEENRFSEEDKIFCEEGEFKIPGTVLHDWRPYGELSFKEVFKKSSNIGVSKIATTLGEEIIYRYIKKLGFGEKTGIDLPGEAKGIVKLPNKWSKTSSYIIPIGQEIAVNLLQLVRAFAVVINGGYLVKPHVLKSIYFEGGKKDYLYQRKKVISSSTCKRAKGILLEVVKDGTGKLAYIEGVKIGGKTGTAQKFDVNLGKYSSTKYRATFVGFIDDIKFPFVIGITIDEPKKHHFGGVVAAPLFKKIVERILNYWGEKILVKK